MKKEWKMVNGGVERLKWGSEVVGRKGVESGAQFLLGSNNYDGHILI